MHMATVLEYVCHQNIVLCCRDCEHENCMLHQNLSAALEGVLTHKLHIQKTLKDVTAKMLRLHEGVAAIAV